MRLTMNSRAERGAYTSTEAEIVSLAAAEAARAEIATWPGYAPTPLLSLPALAAEFGVGEVLYKDESGRLGQGSFKVLGGAYAATLTLRELDGAGPVTLCCATDGNHGRSVAYAAREHGCRSVVFMHEHAPDFKADAIEALGARVVRTRGTYDDSLREAHSAALSEGWVLIADTSEDPADPTTRRVMQGYGVMVLELLDQFGVREPPTHVFLQGGVGGLAAGVAGVLAERYGSSRPTVVVVEPEAAAALFESAVQGAPSRVGGDFRTAMEMLSTGEASPVAWPILQRRADAFMAIDDQAAIAAAERLSRREVGRPALDVGVSGAAGLAGLAELSKDRASADWLGLESSSRVLVFGTEGGAAPLA
ncbi:diaminopropionate ammonia-lyase [Phenylobacterium sp.]|uniref:diaminopropionate ammonia-lyase n=1 Tax=Phenylobacterium sp. TaxID=1871053 RepID=UPI002FC8A553